MKPKDYMNDGDNRHRSALSPSNGLKFLLGGALFAALLVTVFMLSNRMAATQPVGFPNFQDSQFALLDQNGQQRRPDDFAGQPIALFFGFTYCPDVCPTSLQIMTLALETMEASNETVDIATAIYPIFITVDPERDTPAALKQYVSYFHPRLSGWTGTPAQIDDAMRAFKVYRARVEDESNADGYTIDHSSIFYLMGPDGNFLTHFDHAVSPEELAANLNKIIAG